MTNRPSRSNPPRRGAVAPLVALGLVPLIGVLAFAVDGGLLLAARRRAQTVADGAAQAAACRLYVDLAVGGLASLAAYGDAQANALRFAAANGYGNDGITSTVAVNIPPLSGNFAGKGGAAEVIVTLQQPRIFSGIFGAGSWPVRARAVARGAIASANVTPYSTASAVLLDPSGIGALTATGIGTTVVADSPIRINSSSGAALLAANGALVVGPSTEVVGNAVGSLPGQLLNANLRVAAQVAVDPLATLSVPTVDSLSVGATGGSQLSPGVYSGGLSLLGGAFTMAPGVYYIRNGNFTVGAGATLVGKGVTIFMDNGGGSLNLQAGSSVALSPPTAGTYAGLTYFQDRSNTTGLNLAGGASVSIAGTIYAAGARVSVSGPSLTNKYGSQLIARDLSVGNGASLKLTTAVDTPLGTVAAGASLFNVNIVE